MKPKPFHFSSAYQITVCQGSGTGKYWCAVFPENGKEVLYESDSYDDRQTAFDAGCRWVDEATERQFEAAMVAWAEQLSA
jgi:hypothetical protein